LRKRKFPRRNELVVATVKEIEEHGVIVTLEEYGGIEAYIPRSHVASGRIKDIRDYVREGQRVVGRVIRVDRAKGHVDLSLRYVSKEAASKKLEEWKEKVRILAIMRVAASRAGFPDPRAAAEEAWDKLSREYEDPGEVLEDAVRRGPEVLLEAGLDPKLVEELMPLAREHMKPPTYIKQVTLKLVCVRPDGVEVLRETLMAAAGVSSKKASVRVYSAGAPRYVVRVSSEDPALVRRLCSRLVNQIVSAVRKAGGVAEVLEEVETRRRSS